MKRFTRLQGASLFAIVILSAGCANRTPANIAPSYAPQSNAISIRNQLLRVADCGVQNHPPCHPAVPIGRYAVACETYSEPSRPVLPPSYRVDDIGKPGVVFLSPPEVTLARRIQHFVHSRTLRFTIIGPHVAPDSFVVFDATDGPCFDGAPGYRVLNDTSGRAYYQPGEDPGSIHGIPGDVTTPSPGPWCRPRRGVARCY